MKLTDFIEVLLAVFTIVGMVVVGKSNIRKQLISDLQALVVSHQLTIDKLTKESAEKDKRICVLEETIDGYAELVRQGYLSGIRRAPSGNSPTSP